MIRHYAGNSRKVAGNRYLKGVRWKHVRSTQKQQKNNRETPVRVKFISAIALHCIQLHNRLGEAKTTTRQRRINWYHQCGKRKKISGSPWWLGTGHGAEAQQAQAKVLGGELWKAQRLVLVVSKVHITHLYCWLLWVKQYTRVYTMYTMCVHYVHYVHTVGSVANIVKVEE